MMKFLIAVMSLGFVATTGCGGSSAGQTTYADPPAVNIGTGEAFSLVGADTNVVTVNLGASCQVGTQAYQNDICVSATICKSGGSCTTINNLLLDTGSFGLRVFRTSAIDALALPAVTDGSSNPVYNCVSYLDGSAQWGAVVNAKVTLGGEQTTSAIPIEVIDATAMTPAGACSSSSGNTLDTTAAAAGFNGIIGLGNLVYDCGVNCATPGYTDSAGDGDGGGNYFSCNTTTQVCTGYATSESLQVRNPIAAMPANFNNGIILNLPSVDGLGAISAAGQLIIGIGNTAKASTIPSTATYLKVETSTVSMRTIFNGTNYGDAFIDSGSNGLYIPYASNLCNDGEFFCPSTYLNFSATMKDSQSHTLPVSFQIENTNALLNNNSGRNRVFYNFGGSDGATTPADHYFDWGLPIFLGRRVYIGLDGASAASGSPSWSGAFWAL